MMVSTLSSATNLWPQNEMYFIPLANVPQFTTQTPVDFRMDLEDDEERDSANVFTTNSIDIVHPKPIQVSPQQSDNTTIVQSKAQKYRREGKSKSTSSLFPPQKLNRTKNQMQIIKHYQEKMRIDKPQWTKNLVIKGRKSADISEDSVDGKMDIQTAFRQLRLTSPKRKEKEDSDDINEELASISKKAHIEADITPMSARCAAPDPISMIHGEAPQTPRDIATVEIAQPHPLPNIKEQVRIDTHTKDNKVPPLPLCKIVKDDKEQSNPESPDRSKYLINLISPRTAFTSPRVRLTPRGAPQTPKLQREGPSSPIS